MPNSVISVPSQPNRKLYNGGLEWQNDYGNLSDLYQTFYRNYDAALGRFISIDPKAENSQSLTPYHYAANNPLMFNDPLGDDVAGMDAYHYWYYAYRALMYSSDGGTANSRGDVSFFKNQTDAVWTIADRMDKGLIGGGWKGTTAGSFQTFYDNYYQGKLAGELSKDKGTSLREVSIVEAKTNPLWLVERLEESNATNQGGDNALNYFDKNNGDIGNGLAGVGYVSGAVDNWAGNIIKSRSLYGAPGATTILSPPLANIHVPTGALRTTGTVLRGLGTAAGLAGVGITGYQYINKPRRE